jgi:8-oxo-dGTP diphosphatase
VVLHGGQVLLVHRPRRDDWSLPKGKLKRGEHPLAAAVREVREETGVTGRPGVRLPTTRYEVVAGGVAAPKVVDWWHMRVADLGTFTPNDEVDGIAWLPVPAALARLSYPDDRRVLAAFAGLPPAGPPVVLLRERPLDAHGRRQAALLPLFGPQRLVSAPSLQCRQTLGEAARATGLTIEVDARFAEGSHPQVAVSALRDIVSAGQAAVICGQGGIVPALVAQLTGRPERDLVVDEEAGYVLSFAADRLVAADPLSPGPDQAGTTIASHRNGRRLL